MFGLEHNRKSTSYFLGATCIQALCSASIWEWVSMSDRVGLE
jgi:hypothetical protein